MSDQLEAARKAMIALMEEPFVADECGYGPAERDLYHAQHKQALLQALGITDVFCYVCGTWYDPGTKHDCF